jgi:allantoate deiminase
LIEMKVHASDSWMLRSSTGSYSSPTIWELVGTEADRGLSGDSTSLRSETIAADPARIAAFVNEVAAIGRDPRGGWTRLAFSNEERQAHDVFASWASALALDVSCDAIGNSYAELPGRSPHDALMVGSHLDTVPRGGSFDGVAGVAAALEASKVLASGGGIERTLRLVVFAGEEGARFGTPCVGSRVATGAFTFRTLTALIDDSGTSVAQCARKIGLSPESVNDAVWPDKFGATYLELHIEQGAVLEKRGRQIGIVDSIAGSTRFQLTFNGRADHSGATPMTLRRDALAGAAEFILDAERQASAHPTSVATVGRIVVEPGSMTTVPGEARIAVDVRDIDSDAQRELAEALIDQGMRIAGRRNLRLSAELLSDQSPVLLHKPIRERLGRACSELGISFCVMPSGAGHDAAHVADVIPTGLIFVPSKEGVSHAPGEWSDAHDIARGVDVLVAALKSLSSDGPWRSLDAIPDRPDS